jgi:hypothetical protein
LVKRLLVAIALFVAGGIFFTPAVQSAARFTDHMSVWNAHVEDSGWLVRAASVQYGLAVVRTEVGRLHDESERVRENVERYSGQIYASLRRHNMDKACTKTWDLAHMLRREVWDNHPERDKVIDEVDYVLTLTCFRVWDTPR